MATVTEERKLIPRIKTYVICRTHHQDEESIRYMIGIVRSTLVESLKHQTDKDFTFVWLFNEGCKFERYRAKMLKAAGIDFQFFMPTETEARSEIHLGASVFLRSDFVSSVKTLAQNHFVGAIKHRDVVWLNGFAHSDGKTSTHRGKVDVVTGEIFIDPSSQNRYAFLNVADAMWIQVENRLMCQYPDRFKGGHPVKIDWTGWNPALVDRYVMTRMTTGTSKGSTLEPYKSKSLIRVRRPGKVPRGRRRRDDVAE